MDWPALLSLLALAATLFYAVLVAVGVRRVGQLKAQPAEGPTPRLSVIIPALNEADTIEPALRSLLAADYPQLELIAVDDRSTDATGAILDQLAAEDGRLKVLHVHALPRGWLGKNHALHLGARQAGGEYLLFTDADVVFAPAALRQGLGYAVREQLDHLAVLPEIQAEPPLLRMLLLQFMAGFFARYRPWRVRREKARFVGVGAFNLVRRAVYERIGGHGDLAMTPLDDLMLGKRLAAEGAAQDVLYGNGAVSLLWYSSAGAMVRGLGKNAFAAFDYSLVKLTLATLLVCLMGLWPLAGLFVGAPAGRVAAALTLLAGFGLFRDLLGDTRWPRWILLLAPVATLVSVYTWWRSAALALSRGAIEWRGTRYPLKELKARHF